MSVTGIATAFATRARQSSDAESSSDASTRHLDMDDVPDDRLLDALHAFEIPVRDGAILDPHASPTTAFEVRGFLSWWQDQRSVDNERFDVACQHLLEHRFDEHAAYGAIELHRQGVIALRAADPDDYASGHLLHHLARFATVDSLHDFTLDTSPRPGDDDTRHASLRGVFAKLVGAGFDPQERETQSRPCGYVRHGVELHESWTLSLLGSAIKEGNDATARALIALGCPVDEHAATRRRSGESNEPNERQFTALQLAGLYGRQEIAEIIATKVDVRGAPLNHEEPLHDAARYGLVGALDALLARGMRIDTPNGLGETPLDIAVQYRQANTVRTLLHYGARVVVRNDDGMVASPLALAARIDESIALQLLDVPDLPIHDSDGICPALESALLNKFEHLTQALIARDARVDYQVVDYGLTTRDYFPLRDAIHSQRLPLVRAVLDRVVDVNVTDSDGHRAIHHAANTNNGDVMRALVERGADVNVAVAADSSADATMTPLHLAVRQGNVDAVRALIAAGADTHASYRRRTIDESTGDYTTRPEDCLALARRAGAAEIVELVEQRWFEQLVAPAAP